ncbi:hypothetical protein LTR56_027263 [Elasticomyces elasticus]|nr:hypothetical protein LTR56_027263 [Elasticomyces elasticus]KAK5734787.1 hypothetical protein LTS12_026630 [Elasticomyces elasticus]
MPVQTPNSPHKLQQLCDDFVEKLRQTSPTEHAQIYLYQKPKCSGDLSEKVLHLLMCAVPDKKDGQTLKNEMPEFLEDAATIDWLYEMYPEARDSHGVHDHVFKRINHGKEDEKSGKWRKKKVPEELYAGGVDKLCENLFDKAFLEAHEFDVLIVHCVPARGFVSREFGGEDDWGINRDVDIGGKVRTVVFQAHPTYLHIYADQKNLNKFVELIERQQTELDIKVDLSKLQKRLRAMSALPEAKCYPHLKNVVVEFSSQEEMAAKKEEYRVYRNERAKARSDRIRALAASGDPKAMATMESFRMHARKTHNKLLDRAEAGEPAALKSLARKKETDKVAYQRETDLVNAGDPDAIARRNARRARNYAWEKKRSADKKTLDGAWNFARRVPCKTEGCKETSLTLMNARDAQKYCEKCLHDHALALSRRHDALKRKGVVITYDSPQETEDSQEMSKVRHGRCKEEGCAGEQDEIESESRKCLVRHTNENTTRKKAARKDQSASSTQSGLEMFGFATAQKEETDDNEEEDEEDDDEME